MTPQELKNSIICLALQGKLAEQYVDDKNQLIFQILSKSKLKSMNLIYLKKCG